MPHHNVASRESDQQNGRAESDEDSSVLYVMELIIKDRNFSNGSLVTWVIQLERSDGCASHP